MNCPPCLMHLKAGRHSQNPFSVATSFAPNNFFYFQMQGINNNGSEYWYFVVIKGILSSTFVSALELCVSGEQSGMSLHDYSCFHSKGGLQGSELLHGLTILSLAKNAVIFSYLLKAQHRKWICVFKRVQTCPSVWVETSKGTSKGRLQ